MRFQFVTQSVRLSRVLFTFWIITDFFFCYKIQNIKLYFLNIFCYHEFMLNVLFENQKNIFVILQIFFLFCLVCLFVFIIFNTFLCFSFRLLPYLSSFYGQSVLGFFNVFCLRRFFLIRICFY